MIYKLIRLALLLMVILVGYALWTHRGKKDLSARQKILMEFYPLLMKMGSIFGRNTPMVNTQRVQPNRTVFDLHYQSIDGKDQSMLQWKGKKILIVNTASDCGYTAQYAELQQLYEQHAGKLVIIGFPANDFKEQEQGTNENIAAFCQRNYGVQFPLAAKTVVVKQPGQHPLFQWLTDPNQNGWCAQAPGWNFSKYLINESGVLTHYFDTKISPLSNQVQAALR